MSESETNWGAYAQIFRSNHSGLPGRGANGYNGLISTVAVASEPIRPSFRL